MLWWSQVVRRYMCGYDLAYPKELAERMNAFLEKYLYQGLEPEEKAKLQEKMTVSTENKNENRAVEYMLQMEDRNREMLRAGNMHMPDFYNEVQKEALQRLAEKSVTERVMNVEKEKVLRERSVDKRKGIKVVDI